MHFADIDHSRYSMTEWIVAFLGITDPHLVGDKPRWYNYKLDKLNFKAFDPDSKLCNQEWSEYETELFNDIYESDDSERPRTCSVEDDDSSSCYSSVSDTVAEMFRGDIHGETPSGSFKPPFTPPDAASPTPNCMAKLQNVANYWTNEERYDSHKCKRIENFLKLIIMKKYVSKFLPGVFLPGIAGMNG